MVRSRSCMLYVRSHGDGLLKGPQTIWASRLLRSFAYFRRHEFDPRFLSPESPDWEPSVSSSGTFLTQKDWASLLRTRVLLDSKILTAPSLCHTVFMQTAAHESRTQIESTFRGAARPKAPRQCMPNVVPAATPDDKGLHPFTYLEVHG